MQSHTITECSKIEELILMGCILGALSTANTTDNAERVNEMFLTNHQQLVRQSGHVC